MALFDVFKKRKQNKEVEDEKKQELMVNDPDKSLEVVLESLPTTFDEKQENLIEITEPSVLARIDAIIPTRGTAAISFAKAVKKGEKLYKVVLKNGGELVDSRAIAGAKRAMTMGKNGISEQANLIEANASKIGKVANVGATAFNVASIIVGQYYMQQIDTRIEGISDELKGISSTLDIQYSSKVKSLIESVYIVSKFKIDTLANKEVRLQELDNIQELRKDCQTLLDQAEAQVESILGTQQPKYDGYVSSIKKVEKWNRYRSILVQVLAQINELDFTLSMGAKTKEHCYGSSELHIKKSDEIHAEILSWHKKQCELLGIDMDIGRRKNTSPLVKLLEKPITAIKEEWVYKPIEKETIDLIKNQAAETKELSYDMDNRFTEDVEIVVRGDKKYLLAK